jgi:hypothetical protein
MNDLESNRMRSFRSASMVSFWVGGYSQRWRELHATAQGMNLLISRHRVLVKV